MYKHEVDLEQYLNVIKDTQRLKPDFIDYLTMLIKMFNNTVTNPEEYQLEFVIDQDNQATLNFLQIFSVKTAHIKSTRKGSSKSSSKSDTVSINQANVKTVKALSAAFVMEDEDRVKLHIKFRNNIAVAELEETQQRLASVVEIIQAKNPSLIHQLCVSIATKQPKYQELDLIGIAQSRRKGTLSKSSARSGKTAMSGKSGISKGVNF